jgi:N utilization substance protein A
LEGLDDALAEKIVGEGFLSYDDLSVIEPDALMEMGGLTAEQVDTIVAQAEVKAREAEAAAAEERRRQREQERIDAATAAADAEDAARAETAPASGDGSPPESPPAASGSLVNGSATASPDAVVHPEEEPKSDGAGSGEGGAPG